MNSDSSLVEMLLADRERRWRSGEQMTSEECLEAFPACATMRKRPSV